MTPLRYGGLEINLLSYRVFVDGKEIQVTPAGMRVLIMLVRNQDVLLSRDKLLDSCWTTEDDVLDRNVDKQISNLRAVLGKYGKGIKSVYGMGYRLDPWIEGGT